MRFLIAIVCAALLAGTAACGGSAYPSSPTPVSTSTAGAFDYYDDYPPPPDPYDPYPPAPAPAPPPAPAGALAVAPTYGATAGGTPVTITGSGFAAGTTVMFGAAPATEVAVVDAGTITAMTPASVNGWVDVLVSVPGGATLSLPGGFTYADATAPDATATITIMPAGNSPKAVLVAAGARVRLVNSDVRPHDLESDPHPVHSDCPEANGAGFLVPGGSAMTGAFMTPRTCGIHDHNDPDNPAWMSRIIIR
jgi:IPT/TIG domain-containing protein